MVLHRGGSEEQQGLETAGYRANAQSRPAMLNSGSHDTMSTQPPAGGGQLAGCSEGLGDCWAGPPSTPIAQGPLHSNTVHAQLRPSAQRPLPFFLVIRWFYLLSAVSSRS